VLLGGSMIAPGSAMAYTSTTDVVFVHGYGGCQDAATAGAGVLQTQYYSMQEPASRLHAIAYYGCDTDGESIVGYGPRNKTYFASTSNSAETTDIRHIAYELAWYLWDNFGAKNKPVDITGSSMGGLIVTYALQRIAAKDPLYPPSLKVPTVVTFSTPFKGAVSVGCTTGIECQQMAPNSSFVSDLIKAGAPQMTGGTIWLTMGSSAGCDLVPASSSLGLPRVNLALDYTYPCYDHVGYLWDTSTASDAVGHLNGAPWTGAHSLAVMAWALQ
jgi:hypothetical protein